MRLFVALLFTICSFLGFSQENLWKPYFSYNNIRDISVTETMTYYATDNSVVIYNDTNGESKVFNTVNGLRIDDIQSIAYNEEYNKIIVGNALGNVVIINLEDDSFYYLNDIANKNSLSDTEKIVNKILVKDQYAYLATGYGISIIQLANNHFGDTFYIGNNGSNKNILDITFFQDDLYALVAGEGVKKGVLTDNLIDYLQWELVSSTVFENIDQFNETLVGYKGNKLFAITDEGEIEALTLDVNLREIVNYDNKLTFTFRDRIQIINSDFEVIYTLEANQDFKNFSIAIHKGYFIYGGSFDDGLYEIEDMEKISLEGPYSNNSYRIRNSPTNDLWAIFGGPTVDFNPYTGGIKKTPFSVLFDQKWHTIPHYIHQTDVTADVSFDPKNLNRVYISSFLNGLLKVDLADKNPENFVYTKYNRSNTDFPYIEIDQSIRMLGIAFDSDGLGWVTSSQGPNPLVSFDENMNINSYDLGSQSSVFRKPVIDGMGTKWIAARTTGLFAFNERNNKTLFFNPSNSNLPIHDVTSIALDNNNQLWIGTLRGLRVLANVNAFMTSNNLTLSNIVVMDEGTAEELFYEQPILDILVDGANNKWISVADAGVFYISSNGQETFHHFDMSNSPLPSNNVHTIALNNQTGEVFFGTNKGIVSFTNVISTVAYNDLDDVFVYPNPVRPEFNGEVKISGLMESSLVKITDVSGQLVYETTSSGGTVTWNTYNFAGNKVPSGVYMIFVSSPDGTLTTTKKLMIVR